MTDIIDLAQERSEEILQDKIGNIQAAIRRPGVVDGFCEDCDTLIPEERLEAVPWATRCIPCQQEHEKTLK